MTVAVQRYLPRLLSYRSHAASKRTLSSSTTDQITAPITKPTNKQPFCLLDLRQSGLSVVERLCLEECLLRHDSRQWILFGTHHPTKSKYLTIPKEKMPTYIEGNNNNTQQPAKDPCIVVMGIGGKPHLLLDVDKVKEEGVWVIKRFSGGGTVVVDPNCLYTTIIGRNDQLTHVPPYPREIMQWTATDVFGPLFRNLKERAIEQQQQPQSPDQPAHDYPDFELRENDYVLSTSSSGTQQKVAGNAQSIVKTGFLHHTTFLWSFEQENMKYLTLPAKRPDYRKDREHSNFLIQLKDAYQDQLEMGAFFESLETVCHDSFQVEDVSLDEALAVVQDVVGEGGLQTFFETKSRTRLIDLE